MGDLDGAATVLVDLFVTGVEEIPKLDRYTPLSGIITPLLYCSTPVSLVSHPISHNYEGYVISIGRSFFYLRNHHIKHPFILRYRVPPGSESRPLLHHHHSTAYRDACRHSTPETPR